MLKNLRGKNKCYAGFYLLWEVDNEMMPKMTVAFTWKLSSKILISFYNKPQPLTHPRGGLSVSVGIWIVLQIPARKNFLQTVYFILLFSLTSPLNGFSFFPLSLCLPFSSSQFLFFKVILLPFVLVCYSIITLRGSPGGLVAWMQYLCQNSVPMRPNQKFHPPGKRGNQPSQRWCKGNIPTKTRNKINH